MSGSSSSTKSPKKRAAHTVTRMPWWRRVDKASLMGVALLLFAFYSTFYLRPDTITKPAYTVNATYPLDYGEGWDSFDIAPLAGEGEYSPYIATESASLSAALKPSIPINAPHMNVPILMYHYIRVNPVATDKLGFGLSVTPNDFGAQMAYLAAHSYHSVSVGDVADALHGQKILPPNPVVITFDDGYADVYTAAFPILQKYGLRGEAYIITGKIGTIGYVTWDMLRQMQQSGSMIIGAHTVTHPVLPKLSKEQQFSEIEGSRMALQNGLSITVDDFCYPYGLYNADTVSVVAQAGFKDATTTAPGFTEILGREMLFPRVRVSGGETLAEFAKRLQV